MADPVPTSLSDSDRRAVGCRGCWQYDGVYHHKSTCYAATVERIVDAARAGERKRADLIAEAARPFLNLWPNGPQSAAMQDRLSAALDQPPEACECVPYTTRTDYGTGVEHDVDRSSCQLHGVEQPAAAALREAARDYRERVHDETRPGSLERLLGDDACAFLEKRADLLDNDGQ